MFNTNDLCIIKSKTSSNNGVIVKVISYSNGKCKDIIKVQKRDGTVFNIKEQSLRKANNYDILRNFNNKEISSIIGKGFRRRIISRILYKHIMNFKFDYLEVK